MSDSVGWSGVFFIYCRWETWPNSWAVESKRLGQNNRSKFHPIELPPEDPTILFESGNGMSTLHDNPKKHEKDFNLSLKWTDPRFLKSNLQEYVTFLMDGLCSLIIKVNCIYETITGLEKLRKFKCYWGP